MIKPPDLRLTPGYGVCATIAVSQASILSVQLTVLDRFFAVHPRPSGDENPVGRPAGTVLREQMFRVIRSEAKWGLRTARSSA
jgi:hypothetical protein